MRNNLTKQITHSILTLVKSLFGIKRDFYGEITFHVQKDKVGHMTFKETVSLKEDK